MGISEFFKEASFAFDMLSKDNAVKGMILQAARDIFITRTDRDKGHTEYKFAKEGDDLEIVQHDECCDSGLRVINRDNFDQVETVLFQDLEDTFDEYSR